MNPTLTKNEASLLLFFETQAVDYGGLLPSVRMNSEDFETAKRWNVSGFVQFGRIAAKDIDSQSAVPRNYWCVLSDDAWAAAHAERRIRAMRVMKKLSVERIGVSS
jgi:hypothetical protein